MSAPLPGHLPADDALLRLTERHEGPHGSVIVLVAVGSIDDDSYPQFERAVRAILERGSHFIVLDFSNVDYANSMSVGFLIAQHKHLTRLGGAIAVAGLQGPVESLLRLMGLERMLRLFRATDDAVRVLAQMYETARSHS